MTSVQSESGNDERGLNPADVQNVRFTRASMLRPGYVDTEVDHVMSRVAEELARHIAEKSKLRNEVRALRAQIEGTPVHEAPSEQAVRILSSAQQTADAYVAEAEEFSRQMTTEARTVYEEEVRQARENAGAIIQAAQEAAAKVSGGAVAVAGADTGARSMQELEEQVAYLKAFGQACRVQLRSYLEALLSDVEKEWGHADPALLPQQPLHAPAQRSSRDAPDDSAASFYGNTAIEASPARDADEGSPARAGSRSAP